MTAAERMRERHRRETLALYVKTYKEKGNMRAAAKALGISAASLCYFFKHNGVRLETKMTIKIPQPSATGKEGV